jgi:hypothetical protein
MNSDIDSEPGIKPDNINPGTATNYESINGILEI